MNLGISKNMVTSVKLWPCKYCAASCQPLSA